MIDVVRGVLRVRKWPARRGKPRSAAQRFWVDWFKQANLLAKYADGYSMARAIELTRKTGLYPRDILLKAMRGRLYTWVDETGWRWYPMAARQDISESLDVLSQRVGSLLVRAEDFWKDVAPGTFGDVLTHQLGDVPPKWIAPAGGGGISTEILPGSPIVPDGTVNFYDVDVTKYATLEANFDVVGFASSDRPVFRFSIDGGLTFKAAAADYRMVFVNHAGSGFQTLSQGHLSPTAGTTAHRCIVTFTNLRAGRCAWSSSSARASNSGVVYTGFFNFDGPVTDIRFLGWVGANFNAGNIHLVGSW